MKAIAALGLTLTLAACGGAPGDPEKAPQLANPASENCVKLGGRVELRDEANGAVGYCHLPDGRVVEEWSLFRNGK